MALDCSTFDDVPAKPAGVILTQTVKPLNTESPEVKRTTEVDKLLKKTAAHFCRIGKTSNFVDTIWKLNTADITSEQESILRKLVHILNNNPWEDVLTNFAKWDASGDWSLGAWKNYFPEVTNKNREHALPTMQKFYDIFGFLDNKVSWVNKETWDKFYKALREEKEKYKDSPAKQKELKAQALQLVETLPVSAVEKDSARKEIYSIFREAPLERKGILPEVSHQLAKEELTKDGFEKKFDTTETSEQHGNSKIFAQNRLDGIASTFAKLSPDGSSTIEEVVSNRGYKLSLGEHPLPSVKLAQLEADMQFETNRMSELKTLAEKVAAAKKELENPNASNVDSIIDGLEEEATKLTGKKAEVIQAESSAGNASGDNLAEETPRVDPVFAARLNNATSSIETAKQESEILAASAKEAHAEITARMEQESKTWSNKREQAANTVATLDNLGITYGGQTFTDKFLKEVGENVAKVSGDSSLRFDVNDGLSKPEEYVLRLSFARILGKNVNEVYQGDGQANRLIVGFETEKALKSVGALDANGAFDPNFDFDEHLKKETPKDNTSK